MTARAMPASNSENASNKAAETIPAAELDNFYRVLGGHIFFQTLSTAVELDLFTILAQQGEMTRAELANQLGLAEKPVRIILLGLVSLGLLNKTGDKFTNTPVASRYLDRNAPNNMVAIIRWQHHINYRPMSRFLDAVKANENVGLEELPGDEPTLYQRLTHNPELEQIFQDAMEAISVQANKILADNLDLTGVTHLIDVGGGNGENIIRLASKHPNLRASVFDSPSVCEIAKQNIAKAGLSDRLDAIPGNCFDDPFPPDADCILFCHFATIWSEQKNQTLLRKAHNALPAGGSAILFNMMQHNDETGPLTAALGSPYFLTLATGEGMLYTWDEYEQWMRQAGFNTVNTQDLLMDHGVIRGIKA